MYEPVAMLTSDDHVFLSGDNGQVTVLSLESVCTQSERRWTTRCEYHDVLGDSLNNGVGVASFRDTLHLLVASNDGEVKILRQTPAWTYAGSIAGFGVRLNDVAARPGTPYAFAILPRTRRGAQLMPSARNAAERGALPWSETRTRCFWWTR